MARYTVHHNKAGVNTANTIMWQIRTASTDMIELIELGISVRVAPQTGPAWRLNRTTAVGATFTSITPQVESPPVASASVSRLDHTMGTLPTLASTDMRAYGTPNAIGSGIIWTWYDKPLLLAVSTSIAFINANAAGSPLGSFDIYAVFDE